MSLNGDFWGKNRGRRRSRNHSINLFQFSLSHFLVEFYILKIKEILWCKKLTWNSAIGRASASETADPSSRTDRLPGKTELLS